jgi:translocation protein SEC63
MPGDNLSRLTQLPGIQADDVKELESQVTELEEFLKALDMRGDNRVGDVRKAVQNWGRLELVDASFKGQHFCCNEEIG